MTQLQSPPPPTIESDGTNTSRPGVESTDAAVTISPRRVLRFLLCVTLALTVVCVGVDLLKNHSDVRGLTRLVRLLSLNGEANIPSWYSSLLWLIAAFLAGTTAACKKRASGRFVAHWVGFAIVCAYLSLDESAMIHETAGDLISKVFKKWSFLRLDGGWIYSWMYYGIAFVAVFLVVYRNFLLHLPRRVLGLLVVAGTVYLGGAFGVESLSAAADHEKIGELSADTWTLMIGAEEFLEMLGVVLLIYALLTYMRMQRVRADLEVRK